MILICDRNARESIALTEMLYYMGVLSVSVSADKIFSKISTFCKAVVFPSCNSIPAIDMILANLKEYNEELPIFSLSPVDDELRDYFAAIMDEGVEPVKMLSIITEYTEKYQLPTPGEYWLFGHNLSKTLTFRSDKGFSVKITKTENMILKALVCAYPASLKSEEIISLSFRPSKEPGPSNIRTHISSINRKLISALGKPLIYHTAWHGYALDI